MLEFCNMNKIAPICEKVNFMDFPEAFKKTGKSEARYRMLLEIPENMIKKWFVYLVIYPIKYIDVVNKYNHISC